MLLNLIILAVSTQLLKNSNNPSDSKKSDLKSLTIISSLSGMGHTSSIILIGLLIAGLSLNILENFFISTEVLVGFMLIVLGIFTFANKSIFKQKYVHPHTHPNGISHTHSNNHSVDHKHGNKSYLI